MYSVILLILNIFLYYKSDCPRAGKVSVYETTNPADAKLIYEEHGIFSGSQMNKKQHICDSIDGKSNRIFGDVLCKYAISKIFKESISVIERSTCEEVQVRPTGDNMKKVLMAKCVSGSEKHLHIYFGPKENFYYIFQCSTTSTPIACFEIELQDTDLLPIIQPKITINPIEADDIFGIYGQRLYKLGTGNICRTSREGTNKTNLEPICKKAIMSKDFFKKYKVRAGARYKIAAKCVNISIKRQIQNPPNTKYDVTTGINMLKCEYRLIYDCMTSYADPDCNKINTFFIFDGPTTEFVYIGKRAQYDRIPVVEVTDCIKY